MASSKYFETAQIAFLLVVAASMLFGLSAGVSAAEELPWPEVPPEDLAMTPAKPGFSAMIKKEYRDDAPTILAWISPARR